MGLIQKKANGDKLIKYRVKVMCNRCRATGPTMTFDTIGNPYSVLRNPQHSYETEDSTAMTPDHDFILTWINSSINAWNTASRQRKVVEK